MLHFDYNLHSTHYVSIRFMHKYILLTTIYMCIYVFLSDFDLFIIRI